MGNNLKRTKQYKNQITFDIKKQAKGNVDFSLKLYQKIAESNPEGNVAISPAIVTGLLAIVAEGARKNTAAELKNVLKLEEITTKEEFHHLDFIDNALLSLNADIYSELQYTVLTSSRMYVQRSYAILDHYMKTLSRYYMVDINMADFMKNAEKARKTINDQVAYFTRYEIKEAIPEGVISQSSQFVLLNAISMESHWLNAFDEIDTYDAEFKSNNNDSTKVKMMRRTAKFFLLKDTDFQCQFIQMDFSGDKLAMFVLLPDDIQGLELMERKLNPDALNSFMASAIDRPKVMVDLEFPKFRIEMNLKLNEFLKSVGIKDLFSPDDADLSGISPMMGLYVSDMIHKSILYIKEEGNEPLAVSALAKSRTKVSEARETFKADHPFMFYIYDKQAKLMLFMGRFTDPSKAVLCEDG